MEMKQKIGVVILAAGYSSRMGAFKPLLTVGGVPALRRLLDTFQQENFCNIAVVTGHNREELTPFLSEWGAREVFNPNFADGMFTSVKAGLSIFSKEERAGLSGVFLAPVDCPLIGGKTVEVLALALEKKKGPLPFAVPCYYGKKGHPLFIPEAHFDEILGYDGQKGLKGVTCKYEDSMLRLPVLDEGIVLDMDTAEGYRQIEEYWRTGGVRDPIKLRGRIFLVRHGATRQHEAKIFLGQTDVPLSLEGREQAKKAAEELWKHDLQVDAIIASDLKRAEETAAIIAGELGGNGPPLEVLLQKEFREMHLGDWDGCFIHQIKEKYPKQYEDRGRNILRYKTGHEGENFYDLQYRVMKAFGKLLKKYGEKDLVLVAHSGVIKVIICNLMGRDLDEMKDIKVDRGSVTIINKGEVK